MLLLFSTVATLTNFTLYEPLPVLLWNCTRWLIFIEPDINTLDSTKIIVAGVVWSLSFEWLFYFSLPLIGRLLFRIPLGIGPFLISFAGTTLSIILIYHFYPLWAWQRLSFFIAGIIAAFVCNQPKISKIATTKICTIVILIFTLSSFTLFYTSFEFIPYLLLTVSFIIISAGNTLFGILTKKSSRLLGQISYSIYLLHGLLLFNWFVFIFKIISKPFLHWALVSIASIIVVVLSTSTYKYIEIVGMNLGKKIRPRVKERIPQ